MKFYLVTITRKLTKGEEVESQAVAAYDDIYAATLAFHQALDLAMTKKDVLATTCYILDGVTNSPTRFESYVLSTEKEDEK